MATEAAFVARVSAQRHAPPRPDTVLIGLILTLLGIGLVMVASATIPTSSGTVSLHDFMRQALFALVGLAAAAILYGTPLEIFERARYPALALALILLAAVLIPGVGHSANGSARWLSLGSLSLQASEPARLLVLIYVAGYAVSHREPLTHSFWGLAKPVSMVALAGLLLLAEPDFGGTIVLFIAVLGVLFFAGARKRDTLVLVLLFGGAAVALAVASPYRLERLSAFLNPWASAQTTGFQLTQALIATGHGGVFGVGLGESVEKLLYLPEAQSDFIFSVLAEELGLIGVAAVILLFLAFVLRTFTIARRAAAAGQSFAANLAFAIGLFLGVQAFVNIGVNLGVLPTKGLTLPFMSAGGSSLIVDLAACGLLLRAARETITATARGAAAKGVRRRKAKR
ncbi:MAG: putative lipid II flippase FtsW [Gammaproteobacteria bacterium]